MSLARNILIADYKANSQGNQVSRSISPIEKKQKKQ